MLTKGFNAIISIALVQEVGGPARDSTPTPSTPSVPQPMVSTPMLEELASHPPTYLFLNDSELRPQAPILPDILPQPQQSTSELIAMKSAWAGMDSMRLAINTRKAVGECDIPDAQSLPAERIQSQR